MEKLLMLLVLLTGIGLFTLAWNYCLSANSSDWLPLPADQSGDISVGKSGRHASGNPEEGRILESTTDVSSAHGVSMETGKTEDGVGAEPLPLGNAVRSYTLPPGGAPSLTATPDVVLSPASTDPEGGGERVAGEGEDRQYTARSRCSFPVRRRLMEAACATPQASGWTRTMADRDRRRSKMNVIVDTDRHILFCLQNKVASRQMKSYVLGINGPQGNGLPRFTENHHSEIESQLSGRTGLVWLEKIHPPEVFARYGNYTKVLAVRHPLQRLVSGYYQLAHKRKWGFNTTFEEFSQGVISGRENVHFLPYQHMCRPCAMHYDYIIRTELFDDDIPVLNAKLNVASTMTERHVNTQVALRANATQLLKSYKYDPLLRDLAERNPDIFQQILELYQADIDMFGYSWTGRNSDCLITNDGCC